jgi:hypothetical protein
MTIDAVWASALATEVTDELLIDAVIAPKVSFVTHQNDVPVLRELKLVNLGETAAEQIILTAEADPPVFAPRSWRLDRIAGGGGEVRVTQRDLSLNAGLLVQLTEAVRATVTLRARREDGTGPEAERRFPVELLARNEWGDARAASGLRFAQ